MLHTSTYYSTMQCSVFLPRENKNELRIAPNKLALANQGEVNEILIDKVSFENAQVLISEHMKQDKTQVALLEK